MPLKALHHVKFQVRDLDRQEAFATDFGLSTAERSAERLVMKTRGGDPFVYVALQGDDDRFLGLAFEVEEREDLERATGLEGAGPIYQSDLPGGGEAVRLADPDRNEIVLLHGAARSGSGEAYDELQINTPFNKQRFGRNQHPRDTGPARLWRIGHVGLFIRDFAKSTDWYARNLGLIGSDIYHVPGVPAARVVGFFRLDRGDEYVDHHVIAFMQDERGGCHHISFETQDYEAQHRTHRFLRSKDYESIWGVGRHPHGSHVFDVWRSPDGARFETFSDTDLFRKEDGTRLHDISKVVMDEWSNDGPERYFA